jgi:hypothetical protein
MPPNKPFDGVSCTLYSRYIMNKVVFTIINEIDLRIRFYCTARPKLQPPVDFFVGNFRSYAAFEVIRDINEFSATPGVKTCGEWGRHFEDGVLEIWHALRLPFYEASKTVITRMEDKPK